MSVIKSKLNTRSEEFKANSAAMSALVNDLREKTVSVSGEPPPETAIVFSRRSATSALIAVALALNSSLRVFRLDLMTDTRILPWQATCRFAAGGRRPRKALRPP